MGLPMWRDPPVVIDTKKVLKPDPSASTIRRQHSVRRRRIVEAGDARPNPRERYLSYGDSSPIDARALIETIRRDRDRGVTHSADVEERRLADLERIEASNRRRLESGRALLRDALSYEQPSHRARMRESGLRYEMPPPAPSAPDGPDTIAPYRVEVEPLDIGHRSPPRYMPTPPYASGSLSPDSPAPIPNAATTILPSSAPSARVPSLTPRFAPAYGSHTHSEITSVARDRLLRRSRHRYRDAGPYTRERNPDTIPALTLTHSSGLGDRGGSVSPFSSSEDEDTWETLLTTITPDERLPTPSSSFNSQPVSVSFSSNSTQPTSAVSSQGPPVFMTPPQICDSPPTSDGEGDRLSPPPDASRYSTNRTVPRVPDLGRASEGHGRRRRRMAREPAGRREAHERSEPPSHHHHPAPLADPAAAELAAQNDIENELLLQEMISQLDEEDEEELWGEMNMGLEQMRERLRVLTDLVGSGSEGREEFEREMDRQLAGYEESAGNFRSGLNGEEGRELRGRLAWLNERLARVGELSGRLREGRERL